MKKLFKRIKWTWLLFVVGFIFIILFYNKYFSKSSCTNPFEVRDYTLSRKETIKVCNGKIYYGSTIITDKKSYQDLFEYKMNDKYEPTQQRIRIFKQKNETKKRKKVGVSVFFSAFVLEGQKLDRRRSPIAGSFLFSLSALVPLLSSWWKQGARRDIHVERQPLNPGRTQERYRKKEGRRRSLPFCFVCSRPPLFSSFS